MTNLTLNGYIARETEKAIAFVKVSDAGKNDIAPLYVPLSKVIANQESDEMSVRVSLKGEEISRQATPAALEICGEWAEKMKTRGMDLAGW